MLLVSAQALATDVVAEVATSKPAQDALTKVAPSVPSTQDQLLQVTLGLAFVVACIYGVAWFLKRNRSFTGYTNHAIKTMAVMPLSMKDKLMIIEVGDKQILLGITPNNINTLATFDEPVVTSDGKQSSSFSQKLKDILAQNNLPNKD